MFRTNDTHFSLLHLHPLQLTRPCGGTLHREGGGGYSGGEVDNLPASLGPSIISASNIAKLLQVPNELPLTPTEGLDYATTVLQGVY